MKGIKIHMLALSAFAIVSSADVSSAEDGRAIVGEKCASCHDLKGPAPKNIDGLLQKKAPGLFYAGSKFQEKFLVGYLQKPSKLRPAGTVYLNNVKPGKEIDTIDEVPSCGSKLTADEAKAAAGYLMTLKDPNMKTGVYKADETFSKPLAKIAFFKSTACNACHQVEVNGKIQGGVSGAELYDAGSRLNGDWVYSFITDPGYWEPKTGMPKAEINESTARLLTNFVMKMESQGGEK